MASTPILSGLGGVVNQAVNPNSSTNQTLGDFFGNIGQIIANPSAEPLNPKTLFGSISSGGGGAPKTGVSGPPIPGVNNSLLSGLLGNFKTSQADEEGLMKQLDSATSGTPDYSSIFDNIYQKLQTSNDPYFSALGNIYNSINAQLTPDANGNLPANATIAAAGAQTQKNLQGDIATQQGIYNPQISDVKAQGQNQQNTATTQTQQLLQQLQQKARDTQLETQASSKLGVGGADSAVNAAGNASQQPYTQAEVNANQDLQNNLNSIATNTQSAIDQLTGQESGTVQSIQDQLNMLPFATNQQEQQWDSQLLSQQVPIIIQAANLNMSDINAAATESGTIINADVASQKANIDKLGALLSGQGNISNQDLQAITNYINQQIGLTPTVTNVSSPTLGGLGPTQTTTTQTGKNLVANPNLLGY